MKHIFLELENSLFFLCRYICHISAKVRVLLKIGGLLPWEFINNGIIIGFLSPVWDGMVIGPLGQLPFKPLHFPRGLIGSLGLLVEISHEL